MLRIENLVVNYGNVCALKGIHMCVEDGQIVTLIGSNGAGKSTTVNAIAGLVPVKSGSIRFGDLDLTRTADHLIVKAGIALSPEGREVIPGLTVDENLTLGAYIVREKAAVERAREEAYKLFPRLRDRRGQLAGTLSGGEQQMLAIGRALMSNPRMLLLDEPSLGLAPNLVREIFALIQEINRSGKTILLIEQNANMALSIADYAYVLETGNITIEGPAEQLRRDERVRHAYLGCH